MSHCGPTVRSGTETPELLQNKVTISRDPLTKFASGVLCGHNHRLHSSANRGCSCWLSQKQDNRATSARVLRKPTCPPQRTGSTLYTQTVTGQTISIQATMGPPARRGTRPCPQTVQTQMAMCKQMRLRGVVHVGATFNETSAIRLPISKRNNSKRKVVRRDFQIAGFGIRMKTAAALTPSTPQPILLRTNL